MVYLIIDDEELSRKVQPYLDESSLTSSELVWLVRKHCEQLKELAARVTEVEAELQDMLVPLYQLVFDEVEGAPIRLLVEAKRKLPSRADFPDIGSELTAVLYYGTGMKAKDKGILLLGLRGTDVKIEIVLGNNTLVANYFFGSIEQIKRLVSDFVEAVRQGARVEDQSKMYLSFNPFAVQRAGRIIARPEWRTPLPADVQVPDLQGLVQGVLESLGSYRSHLKADREAATAIAGEFVRIAGAFFKLHSAQRLPEDRTRHVAMFVEYREDFLSELLPERQIIEGLTVYLYNSNLFPDKGRYVEQFVDAALAKLYRVIVLGCITLAEYEKKRSQQASAQRFQDTGPVQEGGQRRTTPHRALPTHMTRLQ